MNVLADIVRVKREEVLRLRTQKAPAGTKKPRGALVLERLERGPGKALSLIAEIKRRSPSAGDLSTTMTVADRASAYARNGARMISVLCDEPFFAGSFAHLTEAHEATPDTLLLAKEFVIDERQIEEAAARGADAVLLIVRISDQIPALVRSARSFGLEPLVEIVDEDELAIALAADARVIGVNARDLDTLAMDAARTARVLAAIPEDRIAVHLSGIKGPSDVARLAATDADAALLGEALMREADPSRLLASLVAASVGDKIGG